MIIVFEIHSTAVKFSGKKMSMLYVLCEMVKKKKRNFYFMLKLSKLGLINIKKAPCFVYSTMNKRSNMISFPQMMNTN